MTEPTDGDAPSYARCLGFVREAAAGFPDTRKGSNTSHAIPDAVMSAFAVFFLQSPSWLSCQRAMQDQKGKSNALTLFGIGNVPTNNHVRSLPDPATPERLYEAGRWALGALELAACGPEPAGTSRTGTTTRSRPRATTWSTTSGTARSIGQHARLTQHPRVPDRLPPVRVAGRLRGLHHEGPPARAARPGDPARTDLERPDPALRQTQEPLARRETAPHASASRPKRRGSRMLSAGLVYQLGLGPTVPRMSPAAKRGRPA